MNNSFFALMKLYKANPNLRSNLLLITSQPAFERELTDILKRLEPAIAAPIYAQYLQDSACGLQGALSYSFDEKTQQMQLRYVKHSDLQKDSLTGVQMRALSSQITGCQATWSICDEFGSAKNSNKQFAQTLTIE